MKRVSIFSAAVLAMIFSGTAMAQPGGFRQGGQQGRGQRMGSPQEMISSLFDAADKDGDGKVSKQELTAAMEGMAQMQGRGQGGPGGGRGPGGAGGFGRGPGGQGGAEGRGPGGPGGAEGRGPGGPGGAEGRGPGGPGGAERRGPGGPGGAEGHGPGGHEGRGGPGMGGPRPEPGELLPPFMMEELGLNERQQKRLMALQADVKKKLDSILTDEQKEQLATMHERPEHGAHGEGHGEGRRGPGGERGTGAEGESARPSRPSRPK